MKKNVASMVAGTLVDKFTKITFLVNGNIIRGAS